MRRKIIKIANKKNLIKRKVSVVPKRPKIIGHHRKKEPVFFETGFVVRCKEFDNKELSQSLINNLKIAIIIHVYYDDVIQEILENYLDNFPFTFDLYIATPVDSIFNNSKNKDILIKELKQRNIKFKIITVENKGKDIGGKLNVIKYINNSNLNYDYLILAHDKKSPHISSRIGTTWRNVLLKSIFNPRPVQLILKTFKYNKDVKMCGTRVREGFINSRAIAVNLKNVPYINKLSSFLIPDIKMSTGAFIGGTMFWVDCDYMKSKLTTENIDKILYYLEQGDVQEPSIAHGMERMFGLLVTGNGYKIGKI